MVIDTSNRDFAKLLLKTKLGTPLSELQVNNFQIADLTLTDDTWRFQYRLDRHVLPVCFDHKFRPQHNALKLRYKFRWNTEVISSNSCVHECTNVEDAQHVFWACRVAIHQWKSFFDLLTSSLLELLTDL
ncbi:hypothetical protein Plhal304r1_c036g0111201 [Plasmopara halstedii]